MPLHSIPQCTAKSPKLSAKHRKPEKQAANHEFFHFFQVNLFVESLLQFLKEKKCSETLEFVIQVQDLTREFLFSEDLEKVKQQMQTLFQRYVHQGSLRELNLSNVERSTLLELYSTLNALEATNQKQMRSVLKKLLKALSYQKETFLLQIKEERYNEFRMSSHWDIFVSKLHQPVVSSTETCVDLSFRWITPVKQWTAAQVAQWLQSMGIEEFALFEEHEINGCILQSITREEMIQMGITKIGSLKRLQKIILEVSSK